MLLFYQKIAIESANAKRVYHSQWVDVIIKNFRTKKGSEIARKNMRQYANSEVESNSFEDIGN